MSSYELTFGPVVSRPQRGADGRFLNGSTPHNKGKRWDDYLTPEQQRRSRTTCFSSTYRPANGYRPANSGVKPKPVICLDSSGRLYYFASLEQAAAVVKCTPPLHTPLLRPQSQSRSVQAVWTLKYRSYDSWSQILL